MQWPHVALAGRSVTPVKRHKNQDLLEAASDKAQLVQLADAVIQMEDLELDDLGRQNVELVDEWLEAFRLEAERARNEMKFWRDACEQLESSASHQPHRHVKVA